MRKKRSGSKHGSGDSILLFQVIFVLMGILVAVGLVLLFSTVRMKWF